MVLRREVSELKGGLYFWTERLEIIPAFQCQKTRHPQTRMVMKTILTGIETGVTLHLNMDFLMTNVESYVLKYELIEVHHLHLQTLKKHL